jgi:hypothetical protein
VKTFEVVEKHCVYLTFTVTAKNEEEAKAIAESREWDEADHETTEYENTDIMEV